MASAGVVAVLRELGRLAGSPDSAPAVEQLAAVLAYTREAVAREQVGDCRFRGGGLVLRRPARKDCELAAVCLSFASEDRLLRSEGSQWRLNA
jgi:hypothetical protein